ncbi:MAG: hypothetical protein HY754_10475 [Nitrospirae bacterium]|nr:hypothetical protein [Nitrospirota bacterium]
MEESLNEKQPDIQEEPAVHEEKELTGIKGFFKKNWPVMFLVAFIMYVILLGIGVTAEIFKIQWILDWWIWKAPSR